MINQITAQTPTTWQALEEVVRDILAECGMAAERQVHVRLPRGGADLDVLATDIRDGISTKIVCECKHWNTAVPQHVVHSFRTVLAETGAHRGYIVSKAGFQSGAFEAAHATNIELLTFEEFQAHFYERWLDARLDAFEKSIGNFNSYYELFGIPGMELLTVEAEKEAYYQTWLKYLPLGLVLPSFSPFTHMFQRPIRLPPLPLASPVAKDEVFLLPPDVGSMMGYRELIACLEVHALRGLYELRTHNPITRDRPHSEIVRDDIELSKGT